MHINIPSWTTFVLVGASFTNAAFVTTPTDSTTTVASIAGLNSKVTPVDTAHTQPETHHQYLQRVKRPLANEPETVANSLEDIYVGRNMSRHEKFANKMDNMLFGLGMTKVEKIFQGLMINPPVRYSMRARDELTVEKKVEDSPIFATIVEGIMEALVAVAKDSPSTTPISKEKVEALRVAAFQFADLLEEAANGSSSTTIASRTDSSENHEIDLLPISAISIMVKELGKIATETAKVVTKVVEDIEKLAEDVKERKVERQGLIQHAEKDSKLAARFLPIPGLDPLTVTIHVITAVLAEVGYNYYRSRGESRLDHAQAEFKAQADRLAIVEERLKKELLKNDALKKEVQKHNH